MIIQHELRAGLPHRFVLLQILNYLSLTTLPLIIYYLGLTPSLIRLYEQGADINRIRDYVKKWLQWVYGFGSETMILICFSFNAPFCVGLFYYFS
jgi:hypothetical protein